MAEDRPRRLRLRTRLAWVFGTGFAVLLALVFAALYAWMASETRNNFDRRLLEDLRAGRGLYLAERGEFPTFETAISHALSELRFTDRTYFAVGANHEILARSPILPGQPEVDLPSVLAGWPGAERPFDPVGNRQRAAGLVVADDGTRLFISMSLDPLEALLDRLRIRLGLGLPVVVLLGGILGAWGSGLALRPIGVLAREAEKIGEAVVTGTDRPERLPETGPEDEIRGVARTINALLERLRRALETERELGQHQREFMADAAHELRMPIAVLRSEVEVALERGLDDAAERPVLESVAQEAERLSSLVADLLLLSRGDAMSRPEVHRRVYLDDLVHRAIARVRPLPIARNRTIRIGDFDAAAVEGDPELLARAITALIHNALVHGGDSPIEVSTGLEDLEGIAQAWVIVRDQGPGIPEDQQSKIFDRFVRLDRNRAGSGLGLAIAMEVARLHGGTIEVDSEVGRGSSFRLGFPAAG